MDRISPSTPAAPRGAPFRVAPAVTALNGPFWTGGGEGRLLVMHCSDCGRWNHPPRERCRWCHGANVAPAPVSGLGRVASFTVNHQQWGPEPADPYPIAIVELAEQPGLRLLTNLVGCAPGDVSIGAPVRVVFQPLEDVWLPLFELDPSS